MYQARFQVAVQISSTRGWRGMASMKKRILGAFFLILVVWIMADMLLHNHFLAPLYQQNAVLWQPLNQMNVALVFVVRLVLLGTFVVTYVWLIRPRTFSTGLAFGALTGVALGIAVGFGTYIHSPFPLAMAWAWFIAAILKSLAAGVIVGLLIRENPLNE
jgi:hypothetical protein